MYMYIISYWLISSRALCWLAASCKDCSVGLVLHSASLVAKNRYKMT